MCPGIPKDCDDGDNCTADACDAGECTYAPSGLCSALLEESFGCDGPTGEWEFTVLEGVITWAVDGEPDHHEPTVRAAA